MPIWNQQEDWDKKGEILKTRIHGYVIVKFEDKDFFVRVLSIDELMVQTQEVGKHEQAQTNNDQINKNTTQNYVILMHLWFVLLDSPWSFALKDPINYTSRVIAAILTPVVQDMWVKCCFTPPNLPLRRDLLMISRCS